MTHLIFAPRRATSLTLTLALALGGLLGALAAPTAQAAPPPVEQRDASTGVTADVLPTTQINADGWVWDQAIAGDTVYAGGSFSSARPAGAAAGSNESARSNLLAYTLSTGDLVGSFSPDVNGEVRVLALSPDQKRLYVGGDFTSVDGQTHNHLVAFSTATGQVDPTFKADVNGSVYAISATSTTVYVGGQFTQVNGNDRLRLAAQRASDGLVYTDWVPKTDGATAKALLVAPGGNVVVGGSFATVGRIGTSTVTDAPGSALLDPTNGTAKPWAVNKTVKQFGSDAGVLSLKTDGTTVYGAGFWFGGTQGNYEGVWAVNPSDGSIKWLADCHGDTYDTTVANGVVYAASHQHDCSNIGGFNEQTPRKEWRANAFTTATEGDVQHNQLQPSKFHDYHGYKAPALIGWFPEFANGTGTGGYAEQPTLTIESNSDYVVVGGKFPTVNGVKQQGLVRFAKASLAPKKSGPSLYPSGGPTARAVAGNVVRVTGAPWDRDGTVLARVELWRTDKSAAVSTATNVTAQWWRPALAYTDRDVSAGQTYKYYVKLTDSDGNTSTSATTSVTTPSSGSVSDSTYSKQVLADGASPYWRLDDASGSTATDWAGKQDLQLGSGLTFGAAGAIGSDTAIDATGSGTSTSSSSPAAPVTAPSTFSTEGWFKTTSTAGGQVVGFGSARTGSSGTHDRQVYLKPSGEVVYYLNPGSAKSIQSTKTYNDGKWHQVVATLSPTSGMALYVDGARVASWSASKTGGDTYGYWRVAGDSVPGSGTGWLKGSIDDVSIYPTALSAAQVADHYADSGNTTAKVAPTASFTTSCKKLVCSYDASRSTAAKAQSAAGAETVVAAPTAAAAKPTMRAYAWKFGDGHTGSKARLSHTYAKRGAFDVALTVTNTDGLSDSVIQGVTTADNAAPSARITASAKAKKVTFDGSGSKDTDGRLTHYLWTFGDGSTSTRSKVAHGYVGTGTYRVQLAVTDDDGATASTTKIVSTGGKARAADTFQRSTGGWGSASKGGAWSVSPRSAFLADGGRGKLKLLKAGTTATATLKKVKTTKLNVSSEVTVDKIGTGSGTTASFALRKQGKNEYRTKLVLLGGGKVVLKVSRVVKNKEKVVKTVTVSGLKYRAGEALRFRGQISSASKASIKVTVWRAGTKEPKAQLSVTDSTKALRKAGSFAVLGNQGSTAKNVPVCLYFDNLLAG